MEFWKDETEPIKAFLAMFENIVKDEELFDGLKKVNQLIWFNYTESGPNCSFWVDCRGGQVSFGPGQPTGEPDLTLFTSADDGHRSWLNKLNAVLAITRGKIKVKGSATGLLKLAPKQKKTAEVYAKTLEDLGWADKIIK